MPDDPTGVADGDGVGGDVADHDGTGTNGDIVADGDTWQDGDTAAYPYMMANGDGQGPLLTGVALDGVGAVTGGVDTDVGTDEAVVADGDTGFVKDGEIEVGKEAASDTDLTAIVAAEGLIDQEVIVSDAAQQALDDLPHALRLGGAQHIVFINSFAGSLQLGYQHGIGRIVELARQHFLFLSHSF